jgi:hypothetical protein
LDTSQPLADIQVEAYVLSNITTEINLIAQTLEKEKLFRQLWYIL